jgi:hypothetical protein
MKVKINLETATDIANFVLATSKVKDPVYVTDNDRMCIDGKSFLGLAYAKEFNELWCECDKDIYSLISEFVTES